jgi:hypothetical protein
MSIRAPPSCSMCLWYGHNKRRCHRVIQDVEERERRRQHNYELKVVREQSVYEQSAYEVDQSRRRQLEQREQQEREQPPQSQLRRSFALTQEDVLTFIFNRGNGYKNLLTKSEELKAPHSEVYVSENCPICMEKIGKTNVTTMLCGHQTCSGCFARNIIESQSNQCPMCREKVF